MIEDFEIHNLKPEQKCFLAEVLHGLQKSPKELPCKYFYDEQGSSLFDRICSLDEYYIPRIEIAIMEANITEITESLGTNINLIEYGSGNSTKTRILLDHLHDVEAYIPIDICQEQLLSSTKELKARYPHLNIYSICADYSSNFKLPELNLSNSRKVVYFPGSSIGNFHPPTVNHFLKHIADISGPNGGLLIGIDLKKDPYVLHRAYNDSQGITAAFNLNILKRINRELYCDFDLECFAHYAFYNPHQSRIEMHLMSLQNQTVHLNNESLHIYEGESIWTESSYKFTIGEFKQIAAAAGFKVVKTWSDEQKWFGILYLVNI